MPFHKFEIGKFQCIVLEDNRQVIDIRQELGQVPEDELSAAMKVAGYGDFNVQIGFNNLLVQTGDYNVLIDSGTGQHQLVDSLSEAGISPEQIDYLVITHSDFDHIGGIDDYPNAKIVFPKMAFDLWTTEVSRRKMIDNFQELFLKFLPPDFVAKGADYREHYGKVKLPSLISRMVLVKEEEQFLPGFKMVFTPGHRPDHYAVEIKSDGDTLLHIADGFRHMIQVQHPNWYSRFDNYPEQMAESLALVLERASKNNALLFGSHFTWPGLAKLEGDRVVFVEKSANP